MKSSIKFSFSGYRSLLKTILNKRKIANFQNYKNQKALFLILRHDIEYFTDIALKLGKIENSLGVKSTFFFPFNKYI